MTWSWEVYPPTAHFFVRTGVMRVQRTQIWRCQREEAKEEGRNFGQTSCKCIRINNSFEPRKSLITIFSGHSINNSLIWKQSINFTPNIFLLVLVIWLLSPALVFPTIEEKQTNQSFEDNSGALCRFTQRHFAGPLLCPSRQHFSHQAPTFNSALPILLCECYDTMTSVQTLKWRSTTRSQAICLRDLVLLWRNAMHVVLVSWSTQRLAVGEFIFICLIRRATFSDTND